MGVSQNLGFHGAPQIHQFPTKMKHVCTCGDLLVGAQFSYQRLVNLLHIHVHMPCSQFSPIADAYKYL